MTTEDDFHAHLDAHPDDAHCRLVFADWLQERDDPRAEGYRALGKLRVGWPQHYGPPENTECVDVWCWWPASAYRGHSLPDDWHKLLRGYRGTARAVPRVSYRNYLSRRKAEDAAALAFANLPAKRRAELLATQPAEVPAT